MLLPWLLLSLLATRPEDAAFLESNAQREGVVRLPSHLQYAVLASAPAHAPSPTLDSRVECHYSGRLTDGSEFDSSRKRGRPATFSPRQVIKGWTEALQLMREGDHWELFIPSELAYGDKGSGSIPGGAALIFEIEILKVHEPDTFEVFGVDLKDPQKVGLICIVVAYIVYILYSGKRDDFKGPKVLTAGPGLLRINSIPPSCAQVSIGEASGRDKNVRVFFEVSIGNEPSGRIEFELFNEASALACAATTTKFLCLLKTFDCPVHNTSVRSFLKTFFWPLA